MERTNSVAEGVRAEQRGFVRSVVIEGRGRGVRFGVGCTSFPGAKEQAKGSVGWPKRTIKEGNWGNGMEGHKKKRKDVELRGKGLNIWGGGGT